MPQSRVRAVLGSILVALGILLVAVSVVEQPPQVKTAPNRFYSKADAEQYTKDVQLLQVHAFSKMGSAPLGESELSSLVQSSESAESGGGNVADATPTEVATASERVMAAREKQVAAYANQKTLSWALYGTGIATLLVGALCLFSTRSARRIEANRHSHDTGEQSE